jgi:4-amino-4-deoxy-L-arabinose transferase-like glycosyltransferase
MSRRGVSMLSKGTGVNITRLAVTASQVAEMDRDITTAKKMTSLMQLCICFLILNVVLRFLISCYLPLTYKEAYFWEWAQYLSPGYVDHPPMVAWLIHATTYFYNSNSSLAIRFTPLILGTASTLLIYRLALQLFHDQTIACRALLIALCVPILNITGILMIPDTPLVFFALLIFNVLTSIHDRNKYWAWPLVGMFAGLALLSKLVIILSMIAAIPFIISNRTSRSKSLAVVACLIALVIASPWFFWEQKHGWPGIRLQLWDRHWFDFGFRFSKVREVILEQLFAATPVLFPAILACVFMDKRKLPDYFRAPWIFLKNQVAVVLGVVMIAGVFISQTHPHWPILAYPPACILMAVYWTCFPDQFFTRRLGLLLSILMTFFVLVTAFIVIIPQLIVHIDPHILGGSLGRGLVKGKERMLGLDELGVSINKVLQTFGPENNHVFTDEYQLASLLGYTLKQPVICMDAWLPDKKVIGGFGQYYYLPEHFVNNASGIYLTKYKHPFLEQMLAELFTDVEPMGLISHQYAGESLAQYYLYRVKGFHPPAMG